VACNHSNVGDEPFEVMNNKMRFLRNKHEVLIRVFETNKSEVVLVVNELSTKPRDV
jgi:hypothetical protein